MISSGNASTIAIPCDSSEQSRSLLARSRKSTPAREYVCDYVFRPLAHLVVLALLPLRVPPPVVLLAGTLTGVGAAVALAGGNLLLAAFLVQVKTLMDNADGQLARASGRVSVLGRYLDAESDLFVNAALFLALGYWTGRPWLALVAFLTLTLVLSVDFNLEVLYRRERGELVEPMPPAVGSARLFEHIYGLVYAPHDRLVEWFVETRLRRLHARPEARIAYHDRGTLAVLANLGLSTQLAALGACLVLGRPTWYLWLVLACGVALVPLTISRERRIRQLSPFTDRNPTYEENA